MQVLSVNVAKPREIVANGKAVTTAISKQPVTGTIRLRRLGLEGDDQADKRNHGGLDQAVYVFDHSYYKHWALVLERDDFQMGQFGENLTVDGLLDDEVCIGDTFKIGTATVQVSHPRTPCFKLGIKMESSQIVKAFHQSCRVGFYLRVLEEGAVTAGDPIQRISRDDPEMTVSDVYRVMNVDRDDVEGARKAARLVGLSMEWRERLMERG